MTTPVSNAKQARTNHGPTAIRWVDMGWKDYVRIGLGIAAFILGTLGLVLPILQGILFLIVSAILLAPYSRWIQNKLAQFETRFPWIADKAYGMTRRWHKSNRNEPAGSDE